MKKKVAFPLVLLLFCLSASAQQYFDSLLTVSAAKYPLEKIYIQTDRSTYFPGETIWFKAYIISANNPAVISKTVYADLVNQKGEVLQTKTMPVLQGGAASFFDIPATELAPGLFIRAYSSWMLNFDHSLIDLKPVTILHRKPAINTRLNQPYSLSFFPEGGDLVDHLPCRVAFKACDRSGLPVNVNGFVVNSKGIKQSNLSSIHDGMGYFELLPEAREKYVATWTGPDKKEYQANLPAVRAKGINLHMDYINGQIRYSVTRQDSAEEAFLSFTVVAQMNQQVVYSAKINMHKKTKIVAPILADSLPDGVVQVTVFNALQVPVAERIAFVNNNNYNFNTDLHAVEKNLTRHGRSVLQIDVGGKMISNLSVTVTDADLDKDPANRENIFSYFLLSSDCKGSIYNPSYYFSSDEDSVKRQLDLVMMTNGWRRLRWEAMIAGKWPELIYKPDNYLSVKGKIYGLNKNLLKNRSLNALMRTSGNKSGVFFSIPVEEDGKFKADGLYFFDTLKLYYQFNNDKDKLLTSGASFSFDPGIVRSPATPDSVLSSLSFFPQPDSGTMVKSIRYNNLNEALGQSKGTKTLQNVTVMSKQKTVKEKLDEEYTSGLFKGSNSRVFTIEDDPFAQAAGTVLDYLQGKVAGMQISSNGQPSITRRGHNTDVFLDESHVDLATIQSINMRDVTMIKIFDPPFFGSLGGGTGGAVAVYTRRGGSNPALVRGLNETTIYGYSTIRQFYVPDYEMANPPDLPDYRSTLYWNPFLIFDADSRRMTIPVFNSNNCKRMRVVIEGINEAGQFTREEKIIE